MVLLNLTISHRGPRCKPSSCLPSCQTEVHNGLLRQFFPKRTNLLKMSQDEVTDAVHRLNHRARKCLGYRTPHVIVHGSKMIPLKLPGDALGFEGTPTKHAFPAIN